MFDEEDCAYFARRATAARALAAEATDSAVQRVHADMAAEYERRANGEQAREYTRPEPIPVAD